MKNHKLYRFGTVLVLFALLTCLLTVSAFAGEYEDRYGYRFLDEEQRKVYDQLHDIVAAKQVYEVIIEANGTVKDWTPAYHLEACQVNTEQVKAVIRMFVADYPEYYWFDGEVGLATSGGKVVYLYNLKYTHETAEEAKLFEDAVDKLLADCPKTDDYEKALYIHDKLADHIVYDLAVESEQTAFSAIVDGRAVCAGYARAYQYLLNQVGINAWTVEGISVDPDSVDPETGTYTVVRHAWNLVWLDDNCYYTDVTWDDQGDLLYHAYFNNTLEEISIDHQINEYITLPECNHDPENVMAMNYFVQHNGMDGVIYFTEDTTMRQFKKAAARDDDNNRYCFDLFCAADLIAWLNSEWSEEYTELYGIGNRYTELLLELGFDLDKKVDNILYRVGDEVMFFLYYLDGSELPPSFDEEPDNGGNEPDVPGGDDPALPEEPEENPYEGMETFDGYIASVAENEITAYVSYVDELDDGAYCVWVAYYEDGAFAGVDMVEMTLEDGHAQLTAACPDSFDRCVVFAVTENNNPAPLCDLLQLTLAK